MIKPRWWSLKTQLLVLWRAVRDRRTPWRTRLLIVAALVYAISPFDLVPDWILGVGWIDDLILVPLVLAWASRAIPADLKAELAGAPER